MSGWSLTLQTDRPCYDVGNTVSISGRLTYNDYPQQTVEVSISVTASVSGNPYYYGSPTTDTDGNYMANFTLRSDAESGTYVVHANAEGVRNQTAFQVTDPIRIEENGDVTPIGAPINRNGNTYTLNDNITTNSTNGIIIEKSDIILDGAGFMLDGGGLPNSNGINLTSVNNVTIENISIESFQHGVYQYLCSQCQIIDSNLLHNGNGIYLQQASFSTIEVNNITGNIYAGILLDGSYDNNIGGNGSANRISSNFGAVSLCGSSYSNSLTDNIFANNTMYGVYIEASYNNLIFHNNFFNNTHQGFVTPDSSGNVWDNGYPSGGNYWSDYNGTDLLSGPNQNVTGSDAIGDTPYTVCGNNVDHYPLMQPWNGLPTESSIDITFSASPAAVNSPVTCTAEVFGSNPTGTVVWNTNSSTGGFSQPEVTMFSGNCSTVYIDTSPGPMTITASYSGDLNNAQSNTSMILEVCPITTFDQTGVGSSFNGTIITIDGTNYTASDLPVSFLWVEGSSHSFSYASQLSASSDEQYVWKSTAGLSNVQNGSLIITASGAVIGNYGTQYYLTLATSPSDANTPFGQGWYDSGSYASISSAQFVDIASGSRYSFTGWTTDDVTEIANSTSPSTTILMDKAKTVAANYITQYSITFDQSGVGPDFPDVVLAVDGTGYGINDGLPAVFWWDANSVHTFAYQSPLIVDPRTEQYLWVNTTGLSTLESETITVITSGSITGNYKTQYYLTLATDPSGISSPSGAGWLDAGTNAAISTNALVDIVPGSSRYRFNDWTTVNMVEIADPTRSQTTVLMDEAKTVTADYTIQYNVTFVQTGVDRDSNSTVIVIDESNYSNEAIPSSFWWDNGSAHAFAFQSPLFSTSNTKQYNWTFTTGLSSLQSGSITVVDSGSIIGNYATLVHNVVATNVTCNKKVVCQGFNCDIRVTVVNAGDFAEVFNVNVCVNMTNHANVTSIVVFQNVSLNSRESLTLTFNWNTTGFSKGNYTVIAYVWPAPNETITGNNEFTGGWVLVSMVGDLTGSSPFVPDGKCDGRDITVVAKCFGSSLGDSRYNPNCDILNRGRIDGRDLTIVAKNFGKQDP